MQERALFDEKQVEKIMHAAQIPGVSIAFGAFNTDKDNIPTQEIGFIAANSTTKVGPETVFVAASLSKPVFAYLILKLAQDGVLDLKQPLDKILSFEKFCNDFCEENKCTWKRTEKDKDWIKLLNAQMVLSHTTGLDLFNNKIDFQFEPGTGYRYSGIPILYLQKVIEKKTNLSLERLAKKYVFDPLNMKNSSFYPSYDLGLISDSSRKRGIIYLKTTKAGLEYQMIGPDGELKKNIIPQKELPKDFPDNDDKLMKSKKEFLPIILDHTSKAGYTPKSIAPNSLKTTATDYAKLMLAWINNLTLAFSLKPAVHMVKEGKINDAWGHAFVSEDDMKHLASGLGWELETDNKGKAIKAYKTADMDKWRAIAAIDFEKKTFVVYFANSEHGHILANQIISPYVKLPHALKAFSQKFGFAIEFEPKWQQTEKARFKEIIAYLNSQDIKLPNWQIELVNQIINALNNYYCLPEKMEENKNSFQHALFETFKKINESQKVDTNKIPHSKEEYQIYLDEINKALQTFDPHLAIKYNKTFISERKQQGQIVENKKTHAAKFDFGSGPPQQVLAEMNEFRGHPDRNYGFSDKPPENTVLPNDIGYLKINFLLDPQLGAQEKEDKYRVGPNTVNALNEKMKKLSEKKGIIIDLRNVEEGGSPEMVQYIVSFFIKQKGMVINEIEDRLSGNRNAYKTIDTPHQLFNVPVTILTDNTTFSALEELAYDFQQLNIQLQKDGKQTGDRFRVIGDVTRGGAHPEFSFPLMSSSGEINEHLILDIPYARSINPTSGTNWEDQEKKGVQPDQKVDKTLALEAAVTHLKKVISQKDSKKLDAHASTSSTLFSQSNKYFKEKEKQAEKEKNTHPSSETKKLK